MAQPGGDDAPQEQQGPPQGQGGGEIVKLFQSVGGALQHIQQIIEQDSQTTPQEKQMIGQILQMYGQLTQSLVGDQDQGPQGGGAQGQTSPMEVGANKNAQPVS